MKHKNYFFTVLMMIVCLTLVSCGSQSAPTTLRDSDDPITHSDEEENEVESLFNDANAATESDQPLNDDLLEFFVEGEGPLSDIVESIDFENGVVYTRFAAFSYDPSKVEGLAFSISATDSFPDTDAPYAPDVFYLSENNIEFEDVGVIAYVDAIGHLPNDLYANLTNYSYWESEDSEIVDILSYGTLIAFKPGQTVIHASYGNFTEDITVTVKDASVATSSAANE